MILFIMNLFARLFRIKDEERAANLEINKKAHVPTTGDGYIERQDLLGSMRYGVQKDFLSKMLLKGEPLSPVINSCELIAVYNVLKYFGKQPPFYQVIEDFEKRGASFYGYFGTSIKDLAAYLTEKGLCVKKLRSSDIMPGAKCPEKRVAYILCGENVAGDITAMIHTISLTREGNVLRSHNEMSGGGLYPQLSEAVFGFAGGKGRVLCVYEVTADTGSSE